MVDKLDKNGRVFKKNDIIRFFGWLSKVPEYYIFDGEMIKLPQNSNEIIGNIRMLEILLVTRKIIENGESVPFEFNEYIHEHYEELLA